MCFDWIPTKIGAEMRFNKPFMCIKFQHYWSMHSYFMAENVKCAKRQRKETKEIKQNFCLFLPVAGFAYIWGHLCSKFG